MYMLYSTEMLENLNLIRIRIFMPLNIQRQVMELSCMSFFFSKLRSEKQSFSQTTPKCDFLRKLLPKKSAKSFKKGENIGKNDELLKDFGKKKKYNQSQS